MARVIKTSGPMEDAAKLGGKTEAELSVFDSAHLEGWSAAYFQRQLTWDPVTIYCSVSGNDATGDGTASKPFRNPQRAVESLMNPAEYLHCMRATISMSQKGGYGPITIINGALAGKALTILGTGRSTLFSENAYINYTNISSAGIFITTGLAYLQISNLNVYVASGKQAITIQNNNGLVSYVNMNGINRAGNGIVVSQGSVFMYNCDVSACDYAVMSGGAGNLSLSGCTGSGNNIATHANGGILFRGAHCSIAGTNGSNWGGQNFVTAKTE